jgi:hypothetical protein
MIKVEHISSSEKGQKGSFPNETSDPKIVSRQANRLSKETTGIHIGHCRNMSKQGKTMTR